MSPSWRRRLLLGISPEGITALRFTAGLRPRLDGQWTVPVASATTAATHAIEAPIQSLDEVLREVVHPSDAVTIVLSNHFCHYVVIPGDRKIGKATERMTLAGIVFEQQYGPMSRDWELRVAAAGRGHPTMASGVPRALLAALRETCAGHARLRAIRPALMPVVNRARQSMGSGSCAIGVVEPGRITLAHRREGAWAGVTSRAVAPDDPAALVRLLQESAALIALPAGGKLWLCDLAGGATLPPGSAWQQEVIDLPAAVAGHATMLAALGAVRP